MEQPDLIEQVHTIVNEDIIPLESQLLAEGFNAVLPELETVRAKIREHGLFAPHMPPAYGGLGLPLRTFARVSGELGRTPLGHFAFNPRRTMP